MNTKQKYIFGGVIFLLCICLGFFIMSLFDSPSEKEEQSQSQTDTGVKQEKVVQNSDTTKSNSNEDHGISHDVDSIESITESVESPKAKEAGNKSNESVKVDLKKTAKSVHWDKKDGSYSMTVVVDNPTNDDLTYEIPALKKTSNNGKFSHIKGISSGKYTVIVKNSKGKTIASKDISGFSLKEDKQDKDERQVKGMSASEFQALLQSGKSIEGGKHPKVAKDVSFSYVGIKDGEKKPNDILALREKVNFETWKSFKVVNVGYDKDGRVNSVVIQPIYYDEN